MAAGCQVTIGSLFSKVSTGQLLYKVRRKDRVVFEGDLTALYHFKDPVSSIEKGKECCLTLADFGAYERGDVIECIQVTSVSQEFDDSAARGTNQIHSYN